MISSNSNLNNFSFKKGDKEELIDNGYKCTIDYFENGFFDKFIDEIDVDNNEEELIDKELLDSDELIEKELLDDNKIDTNNSSITDKTNIKEDKTIKKEDLSIEKD